MNTTHALRKAHAVASMSILASALNGVAALLRLPPAVMITSAAALMSIPSAMLMLEPALW